MSWDAHTVWAFGLPSKGCRTAGHFFDTDSWKDVRFEAAIRKGIEEALLHAHRNGGSAKLGD